MPKKILLIPLTLSLCFLFACSKDSKPELHPIIRSSAMPYTTPKTSAKPSANKEAIIHVTSLTNLKRALANNPDAPDFPGIWRLRPTPNNFSLSYDVDPDSLTVNYTNRNNDLQKIFVQQTYKEDPKDLLGQVDEQEYDQVFESKELTFHLKKEQNADGSQSAYAKIDHLILLITAHETDAAFFKELLEDLHYNEF